MVVAVDGVAVIGLPEVAERPGVPVPAQVYVFCPTRCKGLQLCHPVRNRWRKMQ